MKLTVKGQVTIPKKYRQKFGLEPHTEVVFEDGPGGVLIKPAEKMRSAHLLKVMKRVRGIAQTKQSTDEILKLTRDY